MPQVTSLGELMNREFPEQEYIIDKLLPSGSLTIMSGQPASFKTWVLLEAALKAASGEPLFGHFETQQTGVLVVDEESGDRLLQKRLALLNARQDLPIYFHSYQGFELSKKSVEFLIDVCQNNFIGLIIFDSLVRIHGANENEANAMAEVFKQLRKLAASGLTVLIAHHHRKGGVNEGSAGQAMRGSSDILASVDCHIAVTRQEDDTIIISQPKQRYDKELEPFEVRIISDDGCFNFEYVGDTVPTKEATITKLKKTILETLSAKDRFNQREMLAELKKKGTKVNEHKLRTVLTDMVVAEELNCAAGKANSKYYFIGEREDE